MERIESTAIPLKRGSVYFEYLIWIPIGMLMLTLMVHVRGCMDEHALFVWYVVAENTVLHVYYRYQDYLDYLYSI